MGFEMVQAGIVVLTTMVVSALATPVVIRVANQRKLFDLPDDKSVQDGGHRRVHLIPIPRLGGIAIFLSFLLSTAIWQPEPRYSYLVGISSVIFLVGLYDDLNGASVLFRLAIQLIAAFTAVLLLNLDASILTVVPGWTVEIPKFLGVFFAVFVIVGAIQSINMIDGLDGLAGGVVLIGVALLCFIDVVRTGEFGVAAVLGIPIIGALLGFLRFNTHPAKIFLGDCGSNWLGFMVGVLLLLVTRVDHGIVSRKGVEAVPLLSAVFCLAVPIIDTAYVITKRLWVGGNPFKADKSHFHHTLLKIGLEHGQCVTAIYFFSFTIGTLAILPVAYPQYNIALICYVLSTLVALVIPLGTFSSGYFILTVLNSRIMMSRSSTFGTPIRIFLKVWNGFNHVLMYLLLLSFLLVDVPPVLRLGQMAAVSAFAILVTIFLGKKQIDVIDSLVLSIGAGVIFIANNQSNLMLNWGTTYPVQWIYNLIFLVLGVSTLLYMIITFRKRHLVFSPSDFLLMGLPLMMLIVPEPYQSRYFLDIIAMRCLIFFTAIRIMARNDSRSLILFRCVCIGVLLYVAYRSPLVS